MKQAILLTNETKAADELSRTCTVLSSTRDFVLAMMNEAPQCCVIDFDHPGIQPWLLLDICRKQFPDVNVLVCSSKRDFGLMAKILRRGAHDFISKPLRVEDLPLASLAA